MRFIKCMKALLSKLSANITGGDDDTTAVSVSNSGNQFGNTYTSGSWRVANSEEYNVTLHFKGDLWTDGLKIDAMIAADYISTIITSDHKDIPSFFGTYIDDILIEMELKYIDGPSKVLGSTNIQYTRTSGDGTPLSSKIIFDIADATRLKEKGAWSDVILHEMLHALGLGSLWVAKGLINKSVAGDWRYTGKNAVDVYVEEMLLATNGTFIYDGRGIPVESTGGGGTAGKHWDEAVFKNELMTGYVNAENALSRMSIASLADLGYDVSFTAARWGN